MQGPAVTQGYYKNPKQTAETIDDEGWLHTGDVGQVLSNGCFKIIDRKKHIFKLAQVCAAEQHIWIIDDLFINKQGEYVAPEKIENVYVRFQMIMHVYVDGDSLERYLVAIVVPDEVQLRKWYKDNVQSNGVTFKAICQSTEARQYVLKEMQQIGKENGLNSIEQVIISGKVSAISL